MDKTALFIRFTNLPDGRNFNILGNFTSFIFIYNYETILNAKYVISEEISYMLST